jgi:hypothetical protein
MSRCRRWQNIVAAPCQLLADEALHAGPDGRPPKIYDEVILRLAKKFCAGNGEVWDASELNEAEFWERDKGVVNEVGRRKYLALAREELFKQNGGA